jgi:hypothetical protein
MLLFLSFFLLLNYSCFNPRTLSEFIASCCERVSVQPRGGHEPLFNKPSYKTTGKTIPFTYNSRHSGETITHVMGRFLSASMFMRCSSN